MPANERNKEREGEKENGQRRERERERKKKFAGKKKSNARKNKKGDALFFSPPQILHSSLAALWYGAAAAPPAFIGSSLHLPIFFLWVVCSINDDRIRVLFPSFLEKVERDQREKGSDFPSKLCETKRLYNNNTHLYKIFCHLSTRVKLKNAQS